MSQNDNLMACPNCDTLHQMEALPDGARVRCVRCHTVLATSRTDAIVRVLALAVTAMILILAAVFFPFLGIRVGASTNQTSVFDAVLAFADGVLFPLALFVAALIIFLPLLRVCALAYALLPLAMERKPLPSAERALALAEDLKPWSMVEVFIIGVAVSMVKIAGLATVSFGPAFWAFSVLVIVTVLKDTLICRWSLWTALHNAR